jgi:acetate kinase
MRLLVVNAGSSSLKLSLLDAHDRVVASRTLHTPGAKLDRSALQEALRGDLAGAEAVGHRIVHGGQRFREAVVVDEEVQAALEELVDLAPLHQPKSLAALAATREILPGLPAVACFDTAFHATLSAAASTYALPAGWRERWDLRRYGFHGLSHGWVAVRAPQLLQDDTRQLRLVSCHLGAGASLCAISDGRSRDTTMGFTPVEGIVMATRSGSVDPGLLLWLLTSPRAQEHQALSAHELSEALEHRSGLLGLSGSADMREVLRREGRQDADAQLALGVYVHRLRAGIAAMAAALGGLDALVFTGGVGEAAPEVRARAAGGLGFLGVAVDPQLNAHARGDAEITAEGAPARTLVLTAREDLQIARQVRELLGAQR